MVIFWVLGYIICGTIVSVVTAWVSDYIDNDASIAWELAPLIGVSFFWPVFLLFYIVGSPFIIMKLIKRERG